MTNEQIAKVCHEVNRAYCQSIGDESQVVWEDAPLWQQQSAIAGVARAIEGATPEQLHESWLAQKVADGWVYGETKDAEAKTHPCLVSYAQLLPEQRTKDYLFSAVVRSLS